jgi:hypothetical protein
MIIGRLWGDFREKRPFHLTADSETPEATSGHGQSQGRNRSADGLMRTIHALRVKTPGLIAFEPRAERTDHTGYTALMNQRLPTRSNPRAPRCCVEIALRPV